MITLLELKQNHIQFKMKERFAKQFGSKWPAGLEKPDKVYQGFPGLPHP